MSTECKFSWHPINQARSFPSKEKKNNQARSERCDRSDSPSSRSIQIWGQRHNENKIVHTQVTRVVVWHFEPDWFDFKIYLVKTRVGQNIGNIFFSKSWHFKICIKIFNR